MKFETMLAILLVSISSFQIGRLMPQDQDKVYLAGLLKGFNLSAQAVRNMANNPKDDFMLRLFCDRLSKVVQAQRYEAKLLAGKKS